MNLLENAQKKKEEYSKILVFIEKKLYNAPKEKLRVSKSNNHFQYYKSNPGAENKRIYISKKNLPEAEKLAERDYLTALKISLKEEISALNKFISLYKPNALVNCFAELSPARKKLIQPLFLGEKDFAQAWQNKKFEKKQPAPEGNFITLKNERVRSKSEVIIADLLYVKKIPYHYEYPVKLKSGITFYPDFLCLNTRTRQEFYWEHCGKMTDFEYCSNLLRRISEYNKNGIILGENLLLTMESAQYPLDTKDVGRLIDSILL